MRSPRTAIDETPCCGTSQCWEAANQVTEDLRARYADIAWHDLVRVRNRIVHGYATVDVDILVAAAQDDIPSSLAQLRVVAGDLDSSQ